MTPTCLSLAHLTVLDAHPLELIDAASAGGFNAIGLRIVPPMPNDSMVPVVGDEALIRELLAKMKGVGLRVLDVETVWIGPDIDVEALMPAMAVAQRLGARNLLTMGNDPDEGRFTANFAHLCEVAARFDLRVGLEFAAYTHTPSIHAAHRVVKTAAQSNGGVLIDALHMMRSGGTPEDIAMLDPTWLSYCQLADGRDPKPANTDALRAEARGGRFYPGKGKFPLAAILDALPDGLPIGVEAPCAEYKALPVIARGQLCGAATQEFLLGYTRSSPTLQT
jgi:sugar phosphate isomerase/epimerase